MVFFQNFWGEFKEDVMSFIMSEFQERGILSKELGASFIALIPMKIGAVIMLRTFFQLA